MELTAIINKINSFLWGVPLLVLLLGGGIYLSIKLGFPQIHILKIMKKTVFTLFKKKARKRFSLAVSDIFHGACGNCRNRLSGGRGGMYQDRGRRLGILDVGVCIFRNGACLLRKLSGSEML